MSYRSPLHIVRDVLIVCESPLKVSVIGRKTNISHPVLHKQLDILMGRKYMIKHIDKRNISFKDQKAGVTPQFNITYQTTQIGKEFVAEIETMMRKLGLEY